MAKSDKFQSLMIFLFIFIVKEDYDCPGVFFVFNCKNYLSQFRTDFRGLARRKLIGADFFLVKALKFRAIIRRYIYGQRPGRFHVEILCIHRQKSIRVWLSFYSKKTV